jgi:hypothetical protein
MKKILFVLATAAFVASCNKLAENEYIVEGKVDPSFNGKSVYLQKMGGMMGAMPIDTVKVEDGKFIFKDTTSGPSLHIISFEGKPMDVINFILEPGEIGIEVDKDSLFKSKLSGTYNNEKLYTYSQEAIAERKQQQKNAEAFMAKYRTEITQAQTSMDTAALNKLNRLFISQNTAVKDKPLKFIKDNPKAYINIYLLKDLMSKGVVSKAEAKKLFDNFDKEVKDTKEGKELNEVINPKNNPASADAAPTNTTPATVGQAAPVFSAPSPEGKTVSLKESMGKVTVIDFWASWCKPCRAENPNVVAMYNELHSKGLNIIGVSLDKDAASWKKAIADDKLTWKPHFQP